MLAIQSRGSGIVPKLPLLGLPEPGTERARFGLAAPVGFAPGRSALATFTLGGRVGHVASHSTRQGTVTTDKTTATATATTSFSASALPVRLQNQALCVHNRRGSRRIKHARRQITKQIGTTHAHLVAIAGTPRNHRHQVDTSSSRRVVCATKLARSTRSSPRQGTRRKFPSLATALQGLSTISKVGISTIRIS